MGLAKAGKTKLFLTILVIVLLILVGFALYKNKQNDVKVVCIESKKCFNVESVSTPDKMQLGLGNRDSLNQESGMLFIFPQDVYTGFWMKDMRFPIDLLWIDSTMKVVGIEKNMQPCTESSCPTFDSKVKIRYVLEINSGLADKLGLKEKDTVSFTK